LATETYVTILEMAYRHCGDADCLFAGMGTVGSGTQT